MTVCGYLDEQDANNTDCRKHFEGLKSGLEAGFWKMGGK
jgi:hypothetical protein